MMDLDGWRMAWNRAVGDMLRAPAGPVMAERLVEGLRGVAPFQHAIAFAYPPGRRPVFLYNGLDGARRQGSVTAYLRGSYLVDPFYEACCRGIADGTYRMADLAPDAFYDTVGAHPGYVSPCVSDEPGVLSEEIGFFVAGPGGTYIVLSLMRDAERPPFSEAEMVRLREVEPMVLNALLGAFGQPLAGTATGEAAGEGIDAVLDAAATPLTLREREVARLMLLGHSTHAIAGLLRIAVPTVKIHRKNAYSKLGAATQAEFFALFLERLAGPVLAAEAARWGAA